jgi:hypothetical protein
MCDTGKVLVCIGLIAPAASNGSVPLVIFLMPARRTVGLDAARLAGLSDLFREDLPWRREKFRDSTEQPS